MLKRRVIVKQNVTGKSHFLRFAAASVIVGLGVGATLSGCTSGKATGGKKYCPKLPRPIKNQ